MNIERAREFLLGMPHVVETEQFGGAVFWVADKAIEGRMYVMLFPDSLDSPISFFAGPARFSELVELEGFRPAPYLARAFWVAAEHWSVLRDAEWQAELSSAHALTLAKLKPKTLAILALPPAERRRVIQERSRAHKQKEAETKKRKRSPQDHT